jgi:Zn-dependent peptidase ImmA (M78 family)
VISNRRGPYVRNLATRLLKDAAVTDPPVPVDELVLTQGLVITEGTIPQGWGYFDAQAWAIRLSSRLFRETPGNVNRRRFTLAHELGHCVLDHGERSCWNLGSLAEAVQLDDLDDLPDFEQEAHHFARELLLPRAWFKRDWLAEASPERWTVVYGVSRETLFIVLQERRLLMAGRKPR